MTALQTLRTADDAQPRYDFDRHTADYRRPLLRTSPRKCTPRARSHGPTPMTATGWRPATAQVFELARSPHVSNDNDLNNERRGYRGITIPNPDEESRYARGGMLEMDDPEHRILPQVLNPYLSPAAVARWEPFVDDMVRACLDEQIEHGTDRFRR